MISHLPSRAFPAFLRKEGKDKHTDFPHKPLELGFDPFPIHSVFSSLKRVQGEMMKMVDVSGCWLLVTHHGWRNSSQEG